jgi:DNA-binding XRE family transcriptional regulator
MSTALSPVRKKREPWFDAELASAMGFRLLSRRLELGLTQRALAKVAGVSDSTICFCEQGRIILGGSSVVGLCKALKISPNDLFGWEADAP